MSFLKFFRRQLFIIILIGIIFLFVYGCASGKKTQSDTIDTGKFSSELAANDSITCMQGIDDILCKIRNETSRLNMSEAVSYLVCSKNITQEFSNFSTDYASDKNILDIMHAWIFYLSRSDNIKDIYLISDYAAERIYRSTSYDKKKVQGIIYRFLKEKDDDMSYPDDLGILRGRSRERVFQNLSKMINKDYFENIFILKNAQSKSDCKKIVINSYRDELLVDSCNLFFVNDMISYCAEKGLGK